MPAVKPAIAIKGLTVAYDAVPVLWNVDLTIEQGVMMGVVGPNGAGKSTLLKAVLGVVPKLAGEVEGLGKRFTADRQQIGYVPQRTSVDWDFPTTVLDLVKMGTYGRLGWFRRPGLRCASLPTGRSVNFPAASSNARFWLAPMCRTHRSIFWMNLSRQWMRRPKKPSFDC